MLRIVIIDDEIHMRDSLRKLLARHCPQAMVVGEAGSVAGGIAVIQEHHPDVVLLDIQLDDGNGFDLLKALPEADFRVIFITAYDQFAVQAFRFSALDYLLKPINPELLSDAINRAVLQVRGHQEIQLGSLKENMNTIHHQHKKIILKTTDNIYLFELQQIVCCESDSNYTRIFTSDGNKVIVSRTLKEYEDMLSGSGFYRVHKSYLINLAHIRRFEKQDGGYLVLTGDQKIPVASRKREEVLEMLERMAE